MSSRVRVWLCLGLMTVQTLQTVAYLGSSFKILNQMNDIRFDLEIIFSLSTWSPLDCSRKCEANGTCLSFQYLSLTGQCRLFSTIFLHQDAGVYDIGWQYYITSKRRCRDPFVDGRDLDICFMFAGFHNLPEGMEKCAATQSSIISITSTKENVFLIRLAETLTNVSLPDVSYKRPFIQGFWDGVDWILDNGSPLVYTNWDVDQPKKVDVKQNIKLEDGKWQTSIGLKIRPIFCNYIL
ncbi:uncharacterized protein LOC128181742 [Crassostrea angulata]|uniref:uncharacterized protein LOC128181742 n=1 Tax=Magallana angulata TaxID=2784310 RepID=UPI0022B0C6BF|nr:uncharacterized protein LOC128181742 [Crassostrea angulata]